MIIVSYPGMIVFNIPFIVSQFDHITTLSRTLWHLGEAPGSLHCTHG
jgi:hypothetical protein